MGRVKIKHPSPDQDTKLALLRTLSENNVFATKVSATRDGFLVITSLDAEIDIIFNPPCHDALTSQNLTPILPPELKAKRTILLFRVDNYIKQHTQAEIKEEIQRINDFTEGAVDDVYKFPSNNIIKIQFKKTSVAQKALNTGLKLFSMRIPPHDIQEEEYIPLSNCLRCYAIESHPTNDCQKDQSYKLCSECAQEGHLWHECTSPVKLCINCGGHHRTLASQCPKRKEALASKRQAKRVERQAQPTTYSGAASASGPPTSQSLASLNNLPPLKPDTATTILTCFIHAHLVNQGTPGTFQDVLSKTLQANGLPAIKIPDTPDSSKIIKLPFICQEESTATDTEETATETVTEEPAAQENDNTQTTQDATETTKTPATVARPKPPHRSPSRTSAQKEPSPSAPRNPAPPAGAAPAPGHQPTTRNQHKQRNNQLRSTSQ